MQELTTDQLNYLNLGLRQGDIGESLIKRTNTPSAKVLADFERFHAYVSVISNRPVVADDLYFTITWRNFLRILYYADDRDRNCLILQSCFGLTKPFENGGRIVIVNKGNFHERLGQSNEEIYFGDSVYRNQQGQFEHFLNLNLEVPTNQALQLQANFNKLYPGRSSNQLPFIQGYLFPVKPFLTLLLDRLPPFTTGAEFTVRWGLTESTEAGLGHFTLIIGTGDCTTGPVIEFLPTEIKFILNDCPPHTGCSTSVG